METNEKWMKSPSNFERLVLGCMDSYDSNQILIYSGFSRSTRFSYFCTAQISKFQQKTRPNFVILTKFSQFFQNFLQFSANFDIFWRCSWNSDKISSRFRRKIPIFMRFSWNLNWIIYSKVFIQNVHFSNLNCDFLSKFWWNFVGISRTCSECQEFLISWKKGPIFSKMAKLWRLFLLKFWDLSGAKIWESCRSRKMLQKWLFRCYRRCQYSRERASQSLRWFIQFIQLLS